MPSNYEHYVGAGLNHDAHHIVKKSLKNQRKVKAIHYFGPDPILSKENEVTRPITFEDMKTDAALLELSESWAFDGQTNVYPACLMDFEKTKFEGELVAAGYGLTKPVQEPLDDPSLWGWITEAPPKFPELLMTKFKQAYENENFIAVNSSYSAMCYGIWEKRSLKSLNYICR